MQSSLSLRRVRPDFDWRSLRLPGETELEAALAALPPSPAPDDVELSGGILANAEVSPSLHRAKEIVRAVLGMRQAVELFIVPSESWRTGVMTDGEDGSLRLAITSGVAARLLAREATFVLGRLVGKRLLGCAAIPSRPKRIYDPAAQLVRGVERFQELSSDRVGVLCCQDVHVAAKAIIRMTSGLPDELLQIDLPGLLRQRLDEAETLAHGDEHSFCLLRLAAAALFIESEKYSKAFDVASPMDAVKQVSLVGETSEPAAAPIESFEPVAVAAPTQEPNFEPIFESIKPTEALPAPAAAPEPAALELGFPSEAPPANSTPPMTTPISLAFLTSPAEESPAVYETPSPRLTENSPVAPPADSFTRMLRPVADAQGLFEEVYLPVSMASAEPPPTVEERLSPATAARRFTWSAGCWLGSLGDGEDLVRRNALEKLSFVEWRDAHWPADVESCSRDCRRAAEVVRGQGQELRLGVIRDVLSIAAANGRITTAADETVRRMGQFLGIDADEMAGLMAEYVDPEFADYAFSRGQAVQVCWDGSWVPGVVKELEADGDLRVHFAEEGILLRLSPRADLIRPAKMRRIG